MKEKKKLKSTKKIFLILFLIAIVTTGSFAIYKSLFSGNAESLLGDVIVDLSTIDNNENITIDPKNTNYQYKFSISNFKTENSETKVNQVLCDYYIKLTDLEASIPIDVKLYYETGTGTNTELVKETTGEFEGYYKSPIKLQIKNQLTQNYILELTKKGTIAENFTINFNVDLGYTQNIESEDYVNPPDLATGMIPVVYNEITSKWQTILASDTNWYNYNEQKWANVVTVSNYDTYKNTTGVDINYDDITTMFVWIPRYVYRIPTENYHQSVTSESLVADTLNNNLVDVHFSKTQDQGGDFWDKEILVVNAGETSINSYEAWTTNEAFNFGDTYLNGLWIAKFQASDPDNQITQTNKISKLNVVPAKTMQLRANYIEAFTGCRNMEDSTKSGSTYNWATSSNLQTNAKFSTDTNNLDIHMLKNSEYATLAYFAHSKYGTNKKVINGFITPNGITYKFYTGSHNTPEGVFEENKTLTSTGNVYGIYDAPSQTWDMVSAYIGSGQNYDAGMIYTADSRYKDVYTSSTETTDYTSKDSVYRVFKDIKGAAIWETSTNGNASISAWFNGRSNIGVYDGAYYRLFFTRGGTYTDSNSRMIASMFSFGYGYAKESTDSRSFRPVIAVGNGL